MQFKVQPLDHGLLVRAVAERRGISAETVRQMMGHNVVTFTQLSVLTGYSWNKIKGLTMSRQNPRQPILRVVNPFATPQKTGPDMIVMDTECVRLIQESLKK